MSASAIVKWHFDYGKEKWSLGIRLDGTLWSSRSISVGGVYLMSISEWFCGTSDFNIWLLKIHVNVIKNFKIS